MYEEDYSQTSQKRFEFLINRSSKSNYVLGVDYTLGVMTAVSRPDGRNTQIVIRPTNLNKAPIPVTYWRSHPSKILEMMADLAIEYFQPPTAPFTTADVVNLINQQLGLQLVAGEYVNENFFNQVSSIDLQFTTTSLAWLPGTITIALMGANDRVTEDGDVRITEDGQVRITE